jgi:hypothetical protein
MYIADGAFTFQNTAAQTAGAAVRIDLLTIDLNSNLLLKNAGVGANGVGVLCLANNTAPTAHVDNCVQIYSEDVTDLSGSPVTDASLCLYTEKAVISEVSTCTNALAIKINGVVYHMMLTTGT